MNHIHVCFATDDNYAPYCGIAIISILKHADANDVLHLYIIDAGISEENKKKLSGLAKFNETSAKIHTIAFERMDMNRFASMPVSTSARNQVAYFRFVIADVFTHLDKILYLDCDILVQGSLWELYQMDLADHYAAMASTYRPGLSTYRLGVEKYCNSGVMLINCKKWRDEKIADSLFTYVHAHKEMMKFDDEEALNVVFYPRIAMLDEKWNHQIGSEQSLYQEALVQAQKAKIVHFVSAIKPWHPFDREQTRALYENNSKEAPWDINEQMQSLRKKLGIGLQDSVDLEIYIRFLNFVHTLEKDEKLADRKIALLLCSTKWKELDLALTEKGIKTDYYVTIDFPGNSAQYHDAETLISYEEFLKKRSEESILLLLPESFDMDVYQRMQENGLTDMEDFFFETDISLFMAKKQLSEEIRSGKLKGCRRLCLYGTAAMAKRFTRVLYILGVEIPFYIDSFCDEESFLGREVIAPYEISNRKKDWDKILVASAAYAPIWATLNNLGFREDRDYVNIFM